MKGKTAFVISIFTVISLLAGLLLPKLTSAWQDWNGDSQVEICETEEVRLPYSNQVIDSLLLFSGGYHQYADISGGTVHTEAEIEDKALELLDSIAEKYEFVLLEQTDQEFQVKSCTCFLAVSSEQDDTEEKNDRYSAIIWDIDIVNTQGGQVKLFFDDTSGKMISFSWYFTETAENPGQYDVWAWVDWLTMSQICDFFREYYNLSDARESFGEDQDTYLQYMFWEEKYGESIIPVRIMWDHLTFNPGLRYTEE